MSRPAGQRARIGLLGGNFDPFHVGHLALGRAAVESFGLDQLRVIPTGNSWQKPGDQTDSADRLAMTRIAVEAITAARDGCHWLVDDIEVRRAGPSYTVDTLAELRQQTGPETALILILGSDQLRNLASWHRWDDLLTFAHLAVTQRERVPLTDLPAAVESLVSRHGAESLPDQASGSIVFFRMPAVAVSATGVRNSIANGHLPEALLPTGVADYIRRHQLYSG